MNDKRLSIYLNDHLAGATVGCRLANRALKENVGTEFEPMLTTLASEIAEDRRTLRQVMARLSIAPSLVKALRGTIVGEARTPEAQRSASGLLTALALARTRVASDLRRRRATLPG